MQLAFCIAVIGGSSPEAVLAIRPGRPWPTETRVWPTQTARVIPMIPTYTTPVGLPKICLTFDWPTKMKIPRTALMLCGWEGNCGPGGK